MQERMEVRESRQIKAMLHPLRQRIMQYLMDNSPATPSQVARGIDSAANKVHYHMRILEQAGLVSLVETRQVGSVTELYFVPAARSFVITPTTGDEIGLNLVLNAAAQEMKHLLADLRRQAAERPDEPEGRPTTLVHFSRLSAKQEAQAGVDELAGQLKETFAQAVERYPGRRYRLAVLLLPTTDELESDEKGAEPPPEEG